MAINGSNELATAYDGSTDSIKVYEISPNSAQYLLSELADTTNIAAATNYYPSTDGISMNGYRSFSIGYVISGGVTMTVEATNDDSASPDWVDITKSGTELTTNVATTASYVDASGILHFDNLSVSKVRVKSITADNSNGVQYHIRQIY